MSEILKFIEFNQYNLPFLLELLAVYLLLIYLGVVAWVYRDITTRSDNFLTAIAVTLFVLVGNLPALVIYLLVRPERTMDDNRTNNLFFASVLDKSITSCPECHSLVRQEYKYCPTCSAEVQVNCPDCGEIVNPFWSYCSNCNYRLSKPSKISSYLNSIKSSFSKVRSTKIAIAESKPATQAKAQFKLRLPKLRLPAVKLPKLAIKLPKINLSIRRLSLKRAASPAVKVVAAKRHQPQISNKPAVVVEKVETAETNPKQVNKAAKESSQAASKSKSKTPRRGRPKGIKDNKPRKQRADAGKKRGKYKK